MRGVNPGVIVDLVGHDANAGSDVALTKQLRNFLVEPRDASLRIDYEQNDVRGADGGLNLLLDLRREPSEIFASVVVSTALGDIDAEAAGIDELERASIVIGSNFSWRRNFDNLGNAISCGSWSRVDDRYPSSDEPVEQTRLTDVWSTNNGNSR